MRTRLFLPLAALAGEYTASCSDGTLTWTSDGEGETPSGVIAGSPAFQVGS